MNVQKFLGLTASIIPAEPLEMIVAAQEFVDEINNNKIDAFIEMPMPDPLTYPIYELDIPGYVDTVKAIYDGDEPIPSTYTEEEHMLGMISAIKRCYVDRSRKIMFNFSLTGDSDPVTATSTIKCKVMRTGTHTIDSIDDKYIPAAKYFAAARLFMKKKYFDKEQASFNFNLYGKEVAKVQTNIIDISRRNIGSDY